MDHRLLGRTGVSVSPLCLGTMMFGPWGNADAPTRSASSTAPSTPASTSSTPPTSTRTASPRRSSARPCRAAATTSCSPRSSSCRWATDPNHGGGSRRWIMREVENSLRRLGTDYIDLYQVHRPSPDTDVEETLGALTDLVRQGKVRYIGSSSYSGSQIVEAQWAARERNLERFVTEQPPYSILVRGIEEDVLPTAQRHGMGTLTYSPLAGRLALRPLAQGRRRPDLVGAPRLARPFDMSLPGQPAQARGRRRARAAGRATPVSRSSSSPSPSSINHPGVTSAIIGPRTMEQLESQLPAADVTLPPRSWTASTSSSRPA